MGVLEIPRTFGAVASVLPVKGGVILRDKKKHSVKTLVDLEFLFKT